MINAHGVTYSSLAAAQARLAELRNDTDLYGESDGRATEIILLDDAIAAWVGENPFAAAAVAPVGEQQRPRETGVVDDEDGRCTVVQDEFESPCEHPQCALLHRRYFTGTERNDQWVTMPNTGEQRRVSVVGWHEKTNRQWVVLRNGVRVADAYDTKREAVREAEHKPTY